jgi:hypothetical protein
MSEETERKELRQFIERMYDESLAYKFWRGIGRMFAWFPGVRGMVIPLFVSSFIVILLSILVCALLARLIGAVEFFSQAKLTYIISSSIWVWLSINLAEWQIKQSINSIQSNLLDILEFPEGEGEAMKWVEFVASRRNQIIAVVSLFAMMSVFSGLGLKFDYSQPVGWVLLAHLVMGLIWSVFHISWIGAIILFYGYYFSRLSFHLFQDNPSTTLPLLTLHRSGGQLMLVSALIAALAIPVGVITKMLTSLTLIMSVVTLWIPLLAFYIAMERGFSRHIRMVKNQRLSNLQEQISLIEKRGKTPDVGTAELVQRMLEIHEGVRRTPNSLVNIDSLVNLFGSLALPILGALVKLYEIWKQFLGLP